MKNTETNIHPLVFMFFSLSYFFLSNQTHPKRNREVLSVNCNANLSRFSRWGLGATCHDSDSFLVTAATPGTDDPTLDDAFALYNAVQFALDCCFQEVIFERDNASVVDRISGGSLCPRSYVGDLVRGILCKKGGFRTCNFSHIGRKTNKAAHSLASSAHMEPNKVWLEDSPQLVSVLIKDLSFNNMH
jgi:hypothetical protein